MNSLNFLSLRGVSFSYGVKQGIILKDVDLAVRKGERLAVMGGSGSGKSTLLSILGGLTKPLSGEYFYNGMLLNKLSPSELTKFRGERIGFVFQNFNLLPHLTALQNILVAVEHLKFGVREYTKDALRLMNVLRIESLAHRYPNELSGGQCQRVAIARALIRNPEMLLADEPTGSLDQESEAVILDIFASLALHGATVICVTHSQEVAGRLDRTIHLGGGKIVV